MGQVKKWRGKIEVIPVHQKINSDSRKAFNNKVMKIKESEYKEHWKWKAQTENCKPPIVLKNDVAVVKFVKNNKNAIGYICAMCERKGTKLIFIDGSEMW